MSSDKVILLKIGKHIAELRKERGYTQRKLAELLYVGEKTISKWERGVIAPDITMIKDLAKVFNVSAEELLNGEKIENDKSSTIDVINAYSNQTKHKVMKRVIIVVSIILFLLVSLYLIERYYRWDVTNLEANEDFEIHGYAFSNNKETKIIIDSIAFLDPKAGTIDEVKTKSIVIELLSDNKKICDYSTNYDNDISLYKFFHDYSFVCDSNEIVNLHDITLRIDYSQKDYVESRIIQLK